MPASTYLDARNSWQKMFPFMSDMRRDAPYKNLRWGTFLIWFSPSGRYRDGKKLKPRPSRAMGSLRVRWWRTKKCKIGPRGPRRRSFVPFPTPGKPGNIQIRVGTNCSRSSIIRDCTVLHSKQTFGSSMITARSSNTKEPTHMKRRAFERRWTTCTSCMLTNVLWHSGSKPLLQSMFGTPCWLMKKLLSECMMQAARLWKRSPWSSWKPTELHTYSEGGVWQKSNGHLWEEWMHNINTSTDRRIRSLRRRNPIISMGECLWSLRSSGSKWSKQSSPIARMLMQWSICNRRFSGRRWSNVNTWCWKAFRPKRSWH